MNSMISRYYSSIKELPMIQYGSKKYAFLLKLMPVVMVPEDRIVGLVIWPLSCSLFTHVTFIDHGTNDGVGVTLDILSLSWLGCHSKSGRQIRFQLSNKTTMDSHVLLLHVPLRQDVSENQEFKDRRTWESMSQIASSSFTPKLWCCIYENAKDIIVVRCVSKRYANCIK